MEICRIDRCAFQPPPQPRALIALLSQSLQKIKDTVGSTLCTKIALPIVQCIDSFLMSIDADFEGKATLTK